VSITFEGFGNQEINLIGSAGGDIPRGTELNLRVQGPYNQIMWYAGGDIIGQGNVLNYKVDSPPGLYTITAVVRAFNAGSESFFSKVLHFRVVE
jgi:hypothetical protein